MIMDELIFKENNAYISEAKARIDKNICQTK
jgi:hypothetical protein